MKSLYYRFHDFIALDLLFLFIISSISVIICGFSSTKTYWLSIFGAPNNRPSHTPAKSANFTPKRYTVYHAETHIVMKALC